VKEWPFHTNVCSYRPTLVDCYAVRMHFIPELYILRNRNSLEQLFDGVTKFSYHGITAQRSDVCAMQRPFDWYVVYVSLELRYQLISAYIRLDSPPEILPQMFIITPVVKLLQSRWWNCGTINLENVARVKVWNKGINRKWKYCNHR